MHCGILKLSSGMSHFPRICLASFVGVSASRFDLCLSRQQQVLWLQHECEQISIEPGKPGFSSHDLRALQGAL